MRDFSEVFVCVRCSVVVAVGVVAASVFGADADAGAALGIVVVFVGVAAVVAVFFLTVAVHKSVGADVVFGVAVFVGAVAAEAVIVAGWC